MVDLSFVKKKRKKKIAAILSLAGVLGMVSLVVTSYLGKQLGNFTIEMRRNNTALSMASSSTFESPSTYLSVNDVPEHVGYYYADRLDRPKFDDAQIDSEATNGKYYYMTDSQGNKNGTFFFKYTFFIKNTGEEKAYYNSTFSILDVKRDSNYNYDLTDILRVQIYNNDAESDDHESTIYAKREVKYSVDDDTKEEFFDAPVCVVQDEYANDVVVGGYAKQFFDDKTVAKDEKVLIAPNETRRITFVIWLELSDSQCQDSMPSNTSIKLAMNIEAMAYGDEEE